MRRLGVVVSVAAAALVASCSTGTGAESTTTQPAEASAPASSSSAPASAASSPEITAAGTGTGPEVEDDYLPGLAASMWLPADEGPAPLVVLVPGGGWSSADPTGFEPLAERLAASGTTAATVTYRTTDEGATFPQPVDDVACAVRWAAQRAEAEGRPPSRVVVLGHSAGGHLAALVAVSGDEFGADCPAPPVDIDGLVGLAGVYEIRWASDFLTTFFHGSPTDAAAEWDEGDPQGWVDRGDADLAGLDVLLVHGDADSTVPVSLTTDFAASLEAAGVPVEVDVLPDQTHLSVFEADVVGPVLEDWLARAS